MQQKIKTIEEIGAILNQLRAEGKKIVHCHGVFDLLHPGHIRHFMEAKKEGDALVVSLTPDRFVNKGPGRPVFGESLRLEQLASISCIDFVVLNESPDAVSLIKRLKPDFYVKGDEYAEHDKDVTGKISDEVLAVKEVGGDVRYTQDIVFSSSSLINRFFDPDSERLRPFLEGFKKKFSLKDTFDLIEKLNEMNVLVIGDAIIDEYQYVNPLGQAGKGVHMTALCLEKETFLGGSLIIANHLASFARKVTLLTALGEKCPYVPFIRSQLKSNVEPHFTYAKGLPSLLKKRYVIKDGKSLTKLFETYSSTDAMLSMEQSIESANWLKRVSDEFDLILVCDFGNGMTSPLLIEAISSVKPFLAVNTQTNSGNRGFNVITHYHRADFISINEPELRLAAQDRTSRIEAIVDDLSSLLNCKEISITRGVEGVYHYSKTHEFTLPALTTNAIDRIGAGDSYFALAALGIVSKAPSELAVFLGSVAAALDVQIIGNRESIDKVGLCKYVTRLYK